MRTLKKYIAGIAIVALVLFAPSPVTHAAGITLVQTKSAGNGYVNSYTIAPTSSVTVGDTLLLTITAGSANTVSSITDNNGDTFTLANSIVGVTGGRQTWLYYAKNAAAGTPTITVTWGASQNADAATILEEWSGLDTTAPFDVTANNADGNNYVQSHPSGTTATTSQASELVYIAAGCEGNPDPVWAAASGYSNLTQQKASDLYTYSAVSSKVVSSTGTQSATMTTTGFVRGEAIVATFKAAAVVTATVTDTPSGIKPGGASLDDGAFSF